MRTTIDLPDELYRTLKARAALSGTTLRELVQQMIEQGMGQADAPQAATGKTKPPPPIAIPATGNTVPALSKDQIYALELEEDLAQIAGSD